MRRLVAVALILSVLVMLATPHQASGQLAVVDVGAITQLMMTLQVTMEMLGLNVRDLAALAQIGPILQLAQQIGVLAVQIQNEARIIAAIAKGWGVLLDPEMLPCTSRDVRDWNLQASGYARAGLHQLILVNALIDQTIELIATMVQILSLITIISGTTSGAQVAAALQASTVSQLASMQQKMRSFQTIMMGVTAIDQVNTLASDCLARARYTGWGSMGR